MADGSKAGVAGGAVAVLLLGFARVGDDCARGGVRGAAAVDDLARAGGRGAAWEAAGAGIDDAARLGVKVDGAALPGVRGVVLHEGAAGARAGEGSWLEAAGELGIDVGMELVGTDWDDAPPAVVTEPGQVRCPHPIALTRAPGAWDDLLGGEGIACAPVVVVGTATPDGTGLFVGVDAEPLRELSQACVDVGARCLFVGCPVDQAGACVAATEQSLRAEPLVRSLRPYVRGLVARVLAQPVSPVVIAELAEVDGRVGLAVARRPMER
jgi:hypothetical protein